MATLTWKSKKLKDQEKEKNINKIKIKIPGLKVLLPHIRTLTNRIGQLLRNNNLTTIHKPTKKIKKISFICKRQMGSLDLSEHTCGAV